MIKLSTLIEIHIPSNELEVSIRISKDIRNLIKYTSNFPNSEDITELRNKIFLLEKIKIGNSIFYGFFI